MQSTNCDHNEIISEGDEDTSESKISGYFLNGFSRTVLKVTGLNSKLMLDSKWMALGNNLHTSICQKSGKYNLGRQFSPKCSLQICHSSLVRVCRVSFASSRICRWVNALELCLSCTNPSNCVYVYSIFVIWCAMWYRVITDHITRVTDIMWVFLKVCSHMCRVVAGWRQADFDNPALLLPVSSYSGNTWLCVHWQWNTREWCH